MTRSTGKKPDRDQNGRFLKGNKNGGRKKIPEEVKEMFRDATPAAAKLLIDTMHNENVRLDLRIDCANKILERAYGKPTQPIDADLDNAYEVIIRNADHNGRT